MTVRNYVSPTGELILGTFDKIDARADISGIDDETGEPEYDDHTEVFWDSQTTHTDPGNDEILFLDRAGQAWTFGQLTVANDEDAPEAPLDQRDAMEGSDV